MTGPGTGVGSGPGPGAGIGTPEESAAWPAVQALSEDFLGKKNDRQRIFASGLHIRSPCYVQGNHPTKVVIQAPHSTKSVSSDDRDRVGTQPCAASRTTNVKTTTAILL